VPIKTFVDKRRNLTNTQTITKVRNPPKT